MESRLLRFIYLRGEYEKLPDNYGAETLKSWALIRQTGNENAL